MRKIIYFIFFTILIFGFKDVQGEVDRQRLSLRELVKKAADKDSAAMYQLARLHDIGFDSIPVDSARSSALYLQSAEKGYAPAMNYIGFRYYNGEFLKQNTDSAIFWIRRAAMSGDITAAANLGFLLTEGKGMEHNEEEAAKWLETASREGVKEAQIKLVEIMKSDWASMPTDSAYLLGFQYYTGKAPIVGTELLKIAARDNVAKALALLGDAYSKGNGVPYDHQKSIEYFYKAAINGDSSAQFIIAELLDFFPDSLSGEDKDKTGAEYWYRKASQGGVNDSETAYRLLLSSP